MFQKAVKSCLNAAGKEAAQNGTNKDSLRNYIFEKILRSLDHYAVFQNLLQMRSIIRLSHFHLYQNILLAYTKCHL